MRLNRFFTERENIRIGSSVKLPDSDINHIKKVLRLKSGDQIIVFNGEKEFLAELIRVSNKFITARLIKLLRKEDFSEEEKVEITIFQSLVTAQKFDLILGKVTELGVDNIIPVQTEFSQIKIEKMPNKFERWKQIVLSACKQAELIKVPEVFEPIDFSDIEKVKDEFDVFYFFTIPRENIPESKLVKRLVKPDRLVKKVAFLIGPEGGFSPTEHRLAKEWNLEFTELTSTILRTETAAITATAILKFLFA